MGGAESISRQNLGERVVRAKQELKEYEENASKQFVSWSKDDPMRRALILNFEDLVRQRNQIPNNLLFYCWYIDKKRVSQVILNACKNILNPQISHKSTNDAHDNLISSSNFSFNNININIEDTKNTSKNDYQWLKNNLLMSLIWCLKCDDSEYMFIKLNNIVGNYAGDVSKELHTIYNQLETNIGFKELVSIEDKTIIGRQNQATVFMSSRQKAFQSKNKTNRNVETKNNINGHDEKSDSNNSNNRESFNNIYIGLSKLMVVGKNLNDEFHNFMFNLFKPLLNDYRMVEFKRAPLKTFDRCHAKVKIIFFSSVFFWFCELM